MTMHRLVLHLDFCSFQRTWSHTALPRILDLLKLPPRVLKSSHTAWSVAICTEGICQPGSPLAQWQPRQASLSWKNYSVFRDWELRGRRWFLVCGDGPGSGRENLSREDLVSNLGIAVLPWASAGLGVWVLLVNELMLISSSFKSCYLPLARQLL